MPPPVLGTAAAIAAAGSMVTSSGRGCSLLMAARSGVFSSSAFLRAPASLAVRRLILSHRCGMPRKNNWGLQHKV